MNDSTRSDDVLDVRPIPRGERHPQIFGRFEALSVGGAFELLNDHDPRPLRSQFDAKYADAYSWDYVETGPEEWRVRIGKVTEHPDQGLPVLRSTPPGGGS